MLRYLSRIALFTSLCLLFYSPALVAEPVLNDVDLCYFIVDRSGSIESNKLVSPISKAVFKFVERLRPETEVRIVFFDNDSSSPKKWDVMESSQKQEFHNYFKDEFNPGGKTCLFDTVYDNLSQIRGEDYRQVTVIILSDGEDTASKRCSGWKEIEALGSGLVKKNSNSFVHWYTLGFDPKDKPSGNGVVQHVEVVDFSNTNFIKEPAPKVSFTASPRRCEVDAKVLFAPEIRGKFTSVSWDFGDGNSSNKTTPFHAYSSAGTYAVKVKVSGPGGETEVVNPSFVKVSAALAPKAMFSYFPKKVSKGAQVKFNNESEGYTAWEWRVDGRVLTERHPILSFEKTATVELVVSNAKGESDKCTVTVNVEAALPPVAKLAVPSKKIHLGETCTIYDRSSNHIPEKCIWTINGKEVKRGGDLTIKPSVQHLGIATVSLTVFNSDGQKSSVSEKITILPKPLKRSAAAFSWTPEKPVVGDEVIVKPSVSLDKVRHNWTITDEDGSRKNRSATGFKYKCEKAGGVKIVHELVDAMGGRVSVNDSFYVSLDIKPLEITVDKTEGRAPFRVRLAEVSGQKLLDYKWLVNGAEVSSESTPSVLFDKEGEYPVVLRAMTVSGDIIKSNESMIIKVKAPYQGWQLFLMKYWWIFPLLLIAKILFRKVCPKNPKVRGTISWNRNSDGLYESLDVNSKSVCFNDHIDELQKKIVLKGNRGKLWLFEDGLPAEKVDRSVSYELENGISFEIN